MSVLVVFVFVCVCFVRLWVFSGPCVVVPLVCVAVSIGGRRIRCGFSSVSGVCHSRCVFCRTCQFFVILVRCSVFVWVFCHIHSYFATNVGFFLFYCWFFVLIKW